MKIIIGTLIMLFLGTFAIFSCILSSRCEDEEEKRNDDRS